jgi:transcription-repair coupling factor (superfamily II helicase)
MNESILERLQNEDAITHLLNKDGNFIVQDSFSCALLIATSFYKKPQKMCVVANNLYSAQQIYEQLIPLIGEENTLFFPQDEVVRISSEAQSTEMLAQRLYVMENALDDRPRVLIVHVASLTRYLPDVELFKKNTISFKVGEQLDLKKITSFLIDQGYNRVNKIDGQLQFALRGDILDIFPINYDNPIRIDLFDDEIESMRYFSLADQLSYDNINNIVISPASDILKDDTFPEKINSVFDKELKKCKDKLSYDIYLELEKRIKEDIEKMSTGPLNENFYKYYSLFVNKQVNILDYFKPSITFVYNYPQCQDSYDFIISQSYSYFSELFKVGRSLLNYDFFMDFQQGLHHTSSLLYAYMNNTGTNDVEISMRAIPEVANNILKAIENIKSYVNLGKKVIVCLVDNQYDTFKEYLKEYEVPFEEISIKHLPQGDVGIANIKLNEGFELINENLIYLSPREIFGYKSHISKFLTRYKQAKIIKSYEELEKGDYVVHEECGIGQFEEIVTLEVQGVRKDFLKIKYAGDDILFVPLEQFKLVRKYVSKEGAVPKINKMGGNEWEKTKKRIKERVNDLADRLIKLYAERNATPGFAFKEDDEFQYEFEKAFPFPLTLDQQKAVDDIKKDMESPHPMDRLLCGDVGFGKTEVAFRAAFKAILSGAQVALLCPTTILARQHYERAIERFSLFGVRVAMFSRFVSASEQKKQIEEIKKGNIHFIIGTHRLLSQEIVIPNLKLLIIDEEQRFGVEHKEKIKEMSKNIDCLTLSATPIPRTLQMSLVGMRSFSLLSTPPMNRMPIQTSVNPFSEVLIKEAIEKEISRKGQVFYLHNNTASITTTVKKLRNLVKGISIDYVHGKMDRDDIEDVMARFYAGETDVLVCTSIIETGLDISNANTIIIENADNFGLSQLYQIKGRVGRSSRMAYAYLLYDDQKQLSEIASKRLKAIKDFTELGSGIKIAQRDLSIRGAGDILGSEQAGFIDSVGMDMYIKLLNEVVEEKQGIKEKTPEVKISNLIMDNYIPQEYVDEKDKLEVYQEIQSLNNLPSLAIFRNKLEDIYGKLPKEVELVLRKRKIDILSSSVYIDSMKEIYGHIEIVLNEQFSSIKQIGIILFEKLGKVAKNIQGTYINRKIVLKLKKTSTYLDDLEFVLNVINDFANN